MQVLGTGLHFSHHKQSLIQFITLALPPLWFRWDALGGVLLQWRQGCSQIPQAERSRSSLSWHSSFVGLRCKEKESLCQIEAQAKNKNFKKIQISQINPNPSIIFAWVYFPSLSVSLKAIKNYPENAVILPPAPHESRCVSPRHSVP